jgi:demethylspheroidene O-methyltransferase
LRAIARGCSPPGGTLLIAEPMAGTSPAPSRIGDAYFGFYLLAMGSGRPRSPARAHRHCCAAAGFTRTDRPSADADSAADLPRWGASTHR